MGEKKLAKAKQPDVLDYHDYREFLRDYFEYLESPEGGEYSLRGLARTADVSVSALSMFLSGQRSLSSTMLEKLRPHLRLSEGDYQHLELLRGLSEAESLEQRTRYFSRLINRKSFRTRHPREFETFRYMSTWYYVAIREMAALPSFRFEPEWIQSQLRAQIPLEDVTAALKFLEEYKFISRNQVGVPQKNLDCQGGIFRLSLGNFHAQMLQKIIESIDTVKSDERQIIGTTLALSEEDMEQAKVIMAEALRKIEDISHKSKAADTVFHVTLGVAPLTKKRGSNE